MKQIIFALLCGAALTAGSFAAKAESLTEYGGEASNPSYVHITNARYTAGGFLSIIPGFGIGHAAQRRWLEKGWIFTIGEVLLLGGLIYSLLHMKSIAPETRLIRAAGLPCLVGLVGLRGWEMADAWNLPSHYKVSKSPFELSPLYSMNSQGQADFGLSLKYKF